jgi:hypothetical protein
MTAKMRNTQRVPECGVRNETHFEFRICAAIPGSGSDNLLFEATVSHSMAARLQVTHWKADTQRCLEFMEPNRQRLPRKPAGRISLM